MSIHTFPKPQPPATPRACPCCGNTFPFDSFEWLDELQALAARYSGLGITPDLSALALMEAWGLYQWLSRMGV